MLFFEDKPLAMRIIALFLMKFVPEGLALRTRVSFASCWAYAMTVKYFFCCNVNCPEFHSWKPGESCKVSAVNNIFHSDKHKCIVPGVKYCWIYQSQVAGWTLHTKGSQAAKQLCTEKNSPWTGGWIEIPVVPNVEPVTGTRFNKRKVVYCFAG